MRTGFTLILTLAMAALLQLGCPNKVADPATPAAPAAQVKPQGQAPILARPVEHGPPVDEPPLPQGENPFALDKPLQPTLPAERWIAVDLGAAGVTALFPAQPKSKEQVSDSAAGPTKSKAYLALVPDQAAAFSLGMSDMPAAAAEQLAPLDEFKQTRQKMMDGLGSKVKMGEMEEAYQGRPGMRFSFIGQGPSGKPTYFRVRMIRDGQRTYQLMAAHVAGRDVPLDAEYFLRGLRLPPLPEK